MSKQEFLINTTKEAFLMAFLTSLNGIFNLTKKQIECLHAMIMINKSFTATTEIRKQLVKELGLKSVADVTNLVKALKDKGTIIEDKVEGNYKYHKSVVPKSFEVTFKFKVVK